jgi:sulfoxide reductase heme-binding subunit YedZ
VVALGIGPWQVLRTGQPVLNNLLRRDLGIWAALTGIAHLLVATGVVMRPAYFSAYITGPPDNPLPGWAGWIGTVSIVAGYLVGLLVLMLLALSNNWSLARLGAARWKRLQRGAVLALFLTIAHGVTFQVIEGRRGVWLASLLVVSATILGLRWRARRAVETAAG